VRGETIESYFDLLESDIVCYRKKPYHLNRGRIQGRKTTLLPYCFLYK